MELGDIANLALAASLMFALMFVGASRLRIRYGRTWVSVISCAISIVVCGALAATFAYTAYVSQALADQLANSRPAAILASDWGADWPRENRTKYSLMLARATYVERGEIVEYFDLEGRRVAFSPTDQHKQQRAEHLAHIRWLRTSVLHLSILVPVMAFLVSRTPLAHRLVAWEQRLEAKRK